MFSLPASTSTGACNTTPLTSEQKQKAVALATASFAKQAFITFAESISNVDDATVSALEAVRSEKLPSVADVKKDLDRLVGLCDIAFRSSISKDPRIAHFSGLLAEAAECSVVKPPKPAPLGDDNYDIFGEILESIDMSPSVPLNGYGTRCNAQKEADAVLEKFKMACKLQSTLYNCFSTPKIFHAKDNTPAVKSVSDTISRIRDSLRTDSVPFTKEARQKIFAFIMKRESELRGFQCARDALRRKVKDHVEKRYRSGICWLTINSLDQDVLLKIIEFVDFRSASSFMRTCRETRNIQELKKLLPHLSVRHVVGRFPHLINPGIDGGSCNFVVRKTLVHVFVDLAITGTKRTDPESVRLQTTAKHKESQTPVYMDREARHEKEEDDTQMEKRACKEQEVDDSRYRRRLAHETFFSTPIKCTFELVSAEDNEPINDNGCGFLLSMPKWMRKPDAPDTTYTSRDGVPYPAHGAFNIEDLSNNHKNRKFKIKVVGKATTIAVESGLSSSCYQQALVAYSEPFEIVSQKSVSFNVRSRAEAATSRKQRKLGKSKTS